MINNNSEEMNGAVIKDTSLIISLIFLINRGVINDDI